MGLTQALVSPKAPTAGVLALPIHGLVRYSKQYPAFSFRVQLLF